ncbi:hypothetical protein [Clostridium fungisolvens]|uniref:Uncharacterized protein n=1 Tax=Clostridium fungisolvens TaxID=1604897 RepID=A0A6V8SN14_9CLOT|nr:hypothetical protein [Clostridium fungisolvens]GFP78557.1 hypothetical protein bsdtw1_04794 [Clostridium fungisolvens]
MLIELLLKPFFSLLNSIVYLLPSNNFTSPTMTGIFDLLSKGLYFFGSATFILVIGNITFWSVAHIAWAIIEWVYKKIPGIN